MSHAAFVFLFLLTIPHVVEALASGQEAPMRPMLICENHTGDGRYLFPNRKGRPISTNTLEVALKSLGYQDTHCPHGFRSTSTLLNAERITVDGTNLPPPVAAVRPL